MSSFKLDKRLLNDCHVIGKLGRNHVLLIDNADIPWFILVPETQQTEFYQLEHQQQLKLLEHINMLSRYIQQHYTIDKLNIASIGNIVSQLHMHIIGRSQSDKNWPGVVWGSKSERSYEVSEVKEIIQSLEIFCGDAFHHHEY